MPTHPTVPLRRATRAVPTATQTAPSDAAVRSWISVVRAYNQCDQLLARRLAAIGLRTAEHEILANLRRDPGLTQQALAARCFSAKSHISGLLSELETRGWVRREPDPADARAKRLFLAPAGALMAERAVAVQLSVLAPMAQAITPLAMSQVHEAMLALSACLQALIDAPDPEPAPAAASARRVKPAAAAAPRRQPRASAARPKRR
jgi:DNA-binding MarR family transcriptional regulator